ncbi:glycoside hydrolase family 3 N-terminal domain-containing protein [Parvularcula sp. IMCC14364]|uniref:glycoside hydrolase family 3 N-terminal domain-containing protein n=1 Tax=Parvularcula sp. IMCC14364 TaxID=3067902 RepID=UPI002741281D|nr:glycoside hydrolase family 3 N-terminal domain-containing protein [Parvularcula sp. IMCC14364]
MIKSMSVALEKNRGKDLWATLQKMSLRDKIGQLRQVDGSGGRSDASLLEAIRHGRVGSVINVVDPDLVNELQEIALHESPAGVPLVFARDVIHGFKTIFPIPLGQAATWDTDLAREAAHLAALEAYAVGIRWTFAPMIDVSRDPRWGRIAESFGEDPLLNALFGRAMIDGFQGNDLSAEGSIAACAKHFVGYGDSEAGIDYGSTNVSEFELRNVHLEPFRAAVAAGVASVMSSLSDVDGIPATAHRDLIRGVLRDEWGFAGLVVSDWDSVKQLSVHGITSDDKESAYQAAEARIDVEMTSDTYENHLADLVSSGQIGIEAVDSMAMSVLKFKKNLGLFDRPYTPKNYKSGISEAEIKDCARRQASESFILLKNSDSVLPLNQKKLSSICLVGPMADQDREQLGTWVFDGDPARSETPLKAFQDLLQPDCEVLFEKGLATTRSSCAELADFAVEKAQHADAVVAIIGEEAILSGEAHCRANIDLPGEQVELIRRLKATGKTIIVVILSGRPLTIGDLLPHADAVLFALHPGTMTGPAICDLLFGHKAPSGKLPFTLPKSVGQVPIYYSKKNGGRPATHDSIMSIDDIPAGAEQTSFGMTAFHLDDGFEPLFPFGFGLSYTEFTYSDLHILSNELSRGGELHVSVCVRNTGLQDAFEVVQLYTRDRVGSVTRPVKELKAFNRVLVRSGEAQTMRFSLSREDLSFYRRCREYGVEAGEFDLWVGGSSQADLHVTFEIDA